MIRTILLIIMVTLSSSFFSAAHASEIYQSPDAFITEAFQQPPPQPAIMWLQGEVKATIESILNHAYPALRIRYWLDGNRSAWILEEIGKERPITMGFIINSGKIERAKVLIYRESRGWEIRHDFFMDQFKQAQLDEELKLSNQIDSISGATLSVRASVKLAKIALYLHQVAINK